MMSKDKAHGHHSSSDMCLFFTRQHAGQSLHACMQMCCAVLDSAYKTPLAGQTTLTAASKCDPGIFLLSGDVIAVRLLAIPDEVQGL